LNLSILGNRPIHCHGRLFHMAFISSLPGL
jgi:hypothetical protein